MNKGYQIILDYVEGRLPVEEFQKEFLKNRKLKKTLKTKMSSEYQFLREYNYNLYDYFSKDWLYVHKSWDSISVKSCLQGELMRFLDFRGIQYTQYTKYKSDYEFLLYIQPSWVDINDDSILQQIFDEIPQDLSKTQRIKLGKEKIKALFKYDKIYPRWIQGAEWPIVNGKPLMFSHQEKAKGGDIRVYYYFYDEDTKEETIIEQFD